MTSSIGRRPQYRHRQTGWAIVATAFLPFACLATLWFLEPTADRSLPPALLPGLGVASAVALWGFGSLTVAVTSRHVTLRFGLGLYRRSIELDRIREVAVARSRWYEGWGIHWTRRGWLYNVAGFDAVRLDLVDGKTVRIGSDDADRLRSAIERARDARRATRETIG